MDKELQQEIFNELKELLVPYSKGLDLKESDTGYSLNCRKEVKKGMPMFFGAASIANNYVSYYLMPVYVDTSLLDDISPELKKRMQGKSCFNFKTMDKVLFKELKALTKKGYQSYIKGGWIEK